MVETIGFEYFPFVVKYKNKILKLEIGVPVDRKLIVL